ncbi:MAG: glycosyltransferase family 2 protein [Chloroflexota bacterium]
MILTKMKLSNGEDVQPGPLDPAIDLSIVIVSWNVSQLLKDCLHSIFQARSDLNLQVIVVDSGSADDSCQMVRTAFPQVELFDMQENVGFPKGNNIGIRAAVGRNILLLNPDTVVTDSALQTMIAFLAENPTVGLVGPMLRFPNGDIQSSRRRLPTVQTGLFESTWLERFAPKSLLEAYYMSDKPNDQICEADWVMGAAMLATRQAVEQVGGMDEGYFMYSEELDWCKRIKTAGFKIFWLADAEIIHHQGASSDQASTFRHINFNQAKLRYFRKYHGAVASGIIRCVLLLNFAAQLIIECFKWLVGHRRDLRSQRMNAYLQVLKSGLKPAGY